MNPTSRPGPSTLPHVYIVILCRNDENTYSQAHPRFLHSSFSEWHNITPVMYSAGGISVVRILFDSRITLLQNPRKCNRSFSSGTTLNASALLVRFQNMKPDCFRCANRKQLLLSPAPRYSFGFYIFSIGAADNLFIMIRHIIHWRIFPKESVQFSVSHILYFDCSWREVLGTHLIDE